MLYEYIMVVITLLFSSGSVVVTYDVVVPKKESTVIQSNIITAIKKHNGYFAGSAIDGNHVSITGKIFSSYFSTLHMESLINDPPPFTTVFFH